MSRVDELWVEFQYNGWVGPTSFKAALKEYGAEIRKRDAEMCVEVHNKDGTALNCCRAINQEPLP